MAIVPTAENFKVLPQGIDAKVTSVKPSGGGHSLLSSSGTSGSASLGTGNLMRGLNALGNYFEQKEDEAADDAANKYMTYCLENQQNYQRLQNEAAIKDEDGGDVLASLNRDRMNFRGGLTRNMSGRARKRFENAVAGTERRWTLETDDHRFKQEKAVDTTRMNLSVDNYFRDSVDAAAAIGMDSDADVRYRKSLSDSVGVFQEHLKKYYGWYDQQTINQLSLQHLSHQIIGSIEVLKERDPAKALEVFKTYGQALPGELYAKMMHGVIQADEQREAAELWERIKQSGSVMTGATGVGVDRLSKSAFDLVKKDRRPYSRGANRSDCSSFLGEMVAYTGVDKATKSLFVGTSDSIIQNLGKKYGYGVLGGKLPANIGAGVVISMDTGQHDYDKSHWNGIDHIAVTVQGSDGKIYVAEKTQSGAKMTEYNRWKNFGTYRRAKVWTVDVSSAFGKSPVESGGKRVPVNFSDMNMSAGQIMKIIKDTYPGRSDTFYRTLAELARDQGEDNRERKRLHEESIHNQLSYKRLALDQYRTQTAINEAKIRAAKARANAFDQLTPGQQQNYTTSQSSPGEENWAWSGWKLADPNEFREMSLVDVASLTAGDDALNRVMTNTWNWYHNRKKYKPDTPVLTQADINYTYKSLGLSPGNLSVEDKNKIGRTLYYAYTHRKDKQNGKLKFASMSEAIAQGAEEQMGFLERLGLNF